MSKTTKIILAVVLVAVIAGGALVLSGGKEKNKTVSSDGDQSVSATITYDNNGFSPATVTVTSGASVRITNNSSEDLNPSSDPHPIHTKNSELNIGDIEPGQSKTFMLTAKGTWGYHNHYNSGKRGTIIVE